MEITTQDTLKITDITRKMRETFDSINGSTEEQRTNQALEELLAGTKVQNETLEEILKKINTISEEDARKERLQEGALGLTCGMLFGGLGTHIATGGQFDILKNCGKLSNFLGTKYGKSIGAVIAALGVGAGIWGIKHICDSKI